MINPHKNLVILRGWPNSKYANKEYHFTRSEGDELLHCKHKTTSEMAMVARGAKFYRPNELPGEAANSMEPDKMSEIRRMHEYYSHPSINKMKRMSGEWFEDFDVTPQDLDKWNELEGKFCTGCIEGKLKEHARKASSKPLSANRPGENGVADLMFIEGRNEVKTPFYTWMWRPN